jgi:hypothetical protein
MKSFYAEQKKSSISDRLQVTIKFSSRGEFDTAISKAVYSTKILLIIAASVMYQRLQLLRNASTSDMDVDLETLEAYLSVINALSCVAEKNAWIFVSKVDDVESPVPKRIKRDENSTALL